MSKWQSAGELHDITEALDGRDRLFDLYGLSLFGNRAFLAADFAPDPAWAECIVLTEAGTSYIEHARQAGVVSDKATEAFALFQLFYHLDLFVDHTTTDQARVLELLNNMQQEKKAKWPYVFGNSLYNRFNDWPHANKTDHLDPADAERLLDGSPEGVFQTGTLISGPLGFVHGKDQRLLPPTLDVLLWHCSDPGCRARHVVELRKHKCNFQRYHDQLVRHIVDHFGPPSEWHRPILYIHRIGKWPDGRPYHDIPALLGDCIIGVERTMLLARALRSEHYALLTQALGKERSREAASPGKLASSLSQEAQHQLLLMLPDSDLVRFIDELVANKEIKIPPAELRTRKTYAYGPDRDVKSSLSSLGMRSCAHPEVLELASAVWSTYEALGQNDDLLWRLRGHESTTVRHSVLDFIRVHGPEQTIQDLIFPSKTVTTAVAEKYKLQVFAGESDAATTRRLLWKMGFNLSRYEEDHDILRNRLQEFQTCLLSLGPELSENDKAKVRGIGVNLFVSMESFLEELICYNIWVLASDHFTGTCFLFRRSDAHDAVVRILGADIKSGEERFSWSTEGSNTLGTLMAYLHEYRSWLRARNTANKDEVARKKEDFPHYSEDTVWVFPFRHVELWADTPPEVLAAYSEMIETVAKQLAQADLISIRNGLDHKRSDEDFPETDRMLACVSRLQQVLETADAKRLTPKLFWGTRSESDRYGNICDTFADYRGAVVSLWEPPLVLAGPRKSFGIPYLVAPTDFLHQPNSTLLFTVVAKSEYSDYWRGYPRRRFIPPKEQDATRDMGPSSEAEQSPAPYR